MDKVVLRECLEQFSVGELVTEAVEFVVRGGAVEGFLALFLELGFEAGELALSVQGEVTVLYPCKIGRFLLPHFTCGAALVFAKADYGSVVLC